MRHQPRDRRVLDGTRGLRIRLLGELSVAFYSPDGTPLPLTVTST